LLIAADAAVVNRRINFSSNGSNASAREL